jgi:hypothetical protein
MGDLLFCYVSLTVVSTIAVFGFVGHGDQIMKVVSCDINSAASGMPLRTVLNAT